jgi:hypothetical protein
VTDGDVVRRAASPPPENMARRVPDILAYLLHSDSLLALGVLAVVISVLEWLGTLPLVLAGAAPLLARLTWGTYFYLVARKAARGSRRLPVPSDYLDSWETLVQPLMQVSLGLGWYLAPILGFAALRIGLPDFVERFHARPMIFLSQQGVPGHAILAAGILYVPLLVLASLCRRGVWRFLDPSLGLRVAAQVPRAFAVSFALLTALGLVGLAMDDLAARLEGAMPIPIAAPVISQLLRLWAPLAQARMLGGFAHVNARHLRETSVDE